MKTRRRKTSSEVMSIVHLDDVEGIPVLSFPLGRSGKVSHDGVLRFFAKEFASATAEVASLVIDLDGVTILDSSSLSALIAKHEQLHQMGGNLALCRVTSKRLAEVLKITCIDHILPIHPDRLTAVRSLKP